MLHVFCLDARNDFNKSITLIRNVLWASEDLSKIQRVCALAKSLAKRLRITRSARTLQQKRRALQRMVNIQHPLKLATAYVVDVAASGGETDKERLALTRSFLGTLTAQKILKGFLTDKVTLILCGTKLTSNPVHSQSGDSAKNITERYSFAHPDGSFLTFVSSQLTLETPESPASMAAAVYCALDCLVKNTNKRKYARNVYIFSDGTSLNDKDDFSTCIEIGGDLNVNFVCFCLTNDAEHLKKVQSLSDRLSGNFLRLDLAQTVLRQVFPRERAPRVARKMKLSIKANDANLCWDVSLFKKTAKNLTGKLRYSPWCKLCEGLEPLGAPGALKTEYEYYVRRKDGDDDGDLEPQDVDGDGDNHTDTEQPLSKFPPVTDLDPVPSDEVQTAYVLFGQLITGVDLHDAELDFYDSQGIQVHSFLPRASIPRELLVGNVFSVVPGADSSQSASKAFCELCVAMSLQNVVALVRHCIPTQVKMAILWPQVLKSESSTQAQLFMAFLPFANEFTSSTPNFLAKCSIKDALKKLETPQDMAHLPTEEIQRAASDAMDSFVEGNRLDSPAVEPLNRVGDSADPVVQRISQCFHARLLQHYDPLTRRDQIPEPLPPPSVEISKQVDVSPEIALRNADRLLQFIRLRKPQLNKRPTVKASDHPVVIGEDEDLTELLTAPEGCPRNNEKKGPAPLVEKFEESLLASSGEDNIDAVASELLSEAKACILDVGAELSDAITYLDVIRKHAVPFELDDMYNNFLLELKSQHLHSSDRGKTFWTEHFVPHCRLCGHRGLLVTQKLDEMSIREWFETF